MRSHSLRSSLAAFLAASLLTGCSGNGDDESAFETDVPEQAVETVMDLVAGINGHRPSSVLGLFVTAFLMNESRVLYRSAIMGIDAQVRLRVPDDAIADETYGLLQDLGASLQVNVPDLLNRSSDRRETLDEYLDALEELTNRGIDRMTQLEEEFDVQQDELRETRRGVAEIRSDLNRALREQDYSTAGDRQRELATAQAELSIQETEADETNDAINLFEELIDVAQVRWTAITENRDVILAGLEVVEVPGIEDIGVIREETRDQRIERESRTEGVFGETR